MHYKKLHMFNNFSCVYYQVLCNYFAVMRIKVTTEKLCRILQLQIKFFKKQQFIASQ